jgi:hypothetical protein
MLGSPETATLAKRRMPRWLFVLVETTKDGKKKHNHFAYLRPDRSGTTSVENEHTHQIIFIEAQEPQFNEFGELIAEATEGGFQMSPAGDDDHTHEIIGQITAIKKNIFKIPSEPEKEAESVERVKALFKEGRSIEKDAFEDAEEAECIYEGKQWNKSQKADFEAQDRSALTINEVEPKIDMLSGVQRQNRFDIRVLPPEQGDAQVADILTILIKHAHARTKFEEQETRVFEDGAVVGRGAYNVDTNFDKDITGMFEVEKFNWRDFVFGPHERLDAADADYLVKYKWLSKSKLEQMFPDKKDEITKDFNALILKDQEQCGTDLSVQPVKSQSYEESKSKSVNAEGDTKFVDISKKEFLLMEAWQKVYAQVHIAMNITDGFYENLQGWSKEDLKDLESIEGISVIPRVIFKFRVTKAASDTLLDDEFPDLPEIQNEQFYPIIPFYAKKRRNQFWGKVKPVIDLQKENNKRHSQLVDILNRSMPYGWFYDNDTFDTTRDEDDFKKNSSKPGFVAKIRDILRRPQLEQGIKYPAEVTTAIVANTHKMREIMNINTELLGLQNKNLSGVAIRENKRQGLLGNDFLFDNLAFAHRRIGLVTIAHIQKYWSMDRVLRVLGFEIKNDPEINIGGQSAQQIQPNELAAITRILFDQDLTTYDVAVSESAHTPTARLANFLFLKDLASQGVPISPITLLRASDSPDKDRVIAETQQFIEQQGQAEKEKNQTEITKTAIANQNQGGIQQ